MRQNYDNESLIGSGGATGAIWEGKYPQISERWVSKFMQKSNKISQGRKKGSPEDNFMSGDTPDLAILLGESPQTALKRLAPSALAGITVPPKFWRPGSGTGDVADNFHVHI